MPTHCQAGRTEISIASERLRSHGDGFATVKESRSIAESGKREVADPPAPSGGPSSHPRHGDAERSSGAARLQLITTHGSGEKAATATGSPKSGLPSIIKESAGSTTAGTGAAMGHAQSHRHPSSVK